MKQINKNIALRGPTCVAKQPGRRASRSFDLIDKIKCDQPRHVSRDVMNVWNQGARGIVYGERFCGGNRLDGFEGLKAFANPAWNTRARIQSTRRALIGSGLSTVFKTALNFLNHTRFDAP
jgi:hypothetical protein